MQDSSREENQAGIEMGKIQQQLDAVDKENIQTILQQRVVQSLWWLNHSCSQVCDVEATREGLLSAKREYQQKSSRLFAQLNAALDIPTHTLADI